MRSLPIDEYLNSMSDRNCRATGAAFAQEGKDQGHCLVVYGFEFVFKKPGAIVVIKLHHHANAATISHFEVFDGTDFPQFTDNGGRYPVSEAVDFYFLPNLHYCFQYDESFHSVAESGTLDSGVLKFEVSLLTLNLWQMATFLTLTL